MSRLEEGEITYRLSRGDRFLTGYLFNDEQHTRDWLSQKIFRDELEGMEVEKVLILRKSNYCSCCERGRKEKVAVLAAFSAKEFLNRTTKGQDDDN